MATHLETPALAELEAALGRALLVRAAARVMLALNVPVSGSQLCERVPGLDIHDGFGNGTWLAREILDFLENREMVKQVRSKGKSKMYEPTPEIRWAFEEMNGSNWINHHVGRGFSDGSERLNYLARVDLLAVKSPSNS